MGHTPNYNLNVWNASDITAGLIYNDVFNGTVRDTDSNMTIIDGALHENNISKLNLSGGNMKGAINEALVSSMPLAATMNIGAAAGNYIIVTAGTGPITSFDSAPAGARRFMQFSVSATITYNSTYRLIPGAANLDVVSGDVLEWVSGGGGVWRCVNIERWNKSSVRSDLSVNMPTYTSALQIGITLSTTTTLEELALAMPEPSQLFIVPSGSSTSNISPSYARYGALTLTKEGGGRIFAVWNPSNSSDVWIASYASGAFFAWKRMTSNKQSGLLSITIPTGSQNASGTITFSPSFTITPLVTVVLSTGFPGGRSCSLDATTVPTASGFKANAGLSANATGDTVVTMRWYAEEVL